MKIIVQKFGGTSVRDETSRLRAIEHVKTAVDDGYKVVTVVSAMGRKGEPYSTDTILSLIPNQQISNRESDLLVSCGEIISSIVFSNMLNQHGLKAVALTGGQAGLYTNDEFGHASIINMKCDRTRKELKAHDVVVVAGFQGVTSSGEVTTLGRGGSDTSAAALGVALDAAFIDIFTDVEGVMTADPRIVKEARPLSVMTYNEISNMAYQGAKVIHPRAVEIAMQAKVPIRVRSTYSDSKGTLVTAVAHESKDHFINDRVITGITHVSGISQIKVEANSQQLNLQAEVFKAMAQANISVDFINISPTGVVYTVNDTVTDKAVATLERLGYDVSVVRNCAKVSAVGAGMTGVPGVTATIVNALLSEEIPILQSADSHTTIWSLVKGEDMEKAVNALHKAFKLEQGVQNI